ncbi:hypothetical protein DL98DRAFT_545593 [Cadophora sp. DSE1049]|nr:hypothetical protein DL98DRAFT_545593 [Cadophora sp. DSE1049]
MLVKPSQRHYRSHYRKIHLIEWRRKRVTGNPPIVVALVSWVSSEKAGRVQQLLWTLLKSVLIMPAVVFYVIWSTFLRNETHPKHVLNSLDADLRAPTDVSGLQEYDAGVLYNVQGDLKRLIRPRALVVYRNGNWNVEADGRYTGPYLFISFAASHFVKLLPGTEFGRVLDEAELDDRARRLVIKLGMSAYWADYHCRALRQPEATDDVHRFCDVVRGAAQVMILLPDKTPQALAFYGQRLWCLPEALLARYHRVSICTPDPESPVDSIETVELMEMVSRAWAVQITTNGNLISDGNEETFRLLVEHITGSLTLSRLEYIQVALEALRSRQWREFYRRDIAYALMTLISRRPRMDPTDTEFQALARLFLVQDTDRIIERMACMDQARVSDGMSIWFNTNDDLGAKLWDIEPLCQVAGICHDGGIILDGCHGISIRWKDFPRMEYHTGDSWTRTWIRFRLRAATISIFAGAILVGVEHHNGNIVQYLGISVAVVGFFLLLFVISRIPEIYGGKIRKSQPWLVGFEGRMPLQRVETVMFGDCIGRLHYTPSSGPYCSKSPDGRFGIEPPEDITNLVPRGCRLFTLVDTGNMTVTLFFAMKPPSVALICGKEGGMLRTVLCSYERSNNSCVKQCVLRMETPMLQKCDMLGWVKLK